ncbi:MAG TPA: DUF3134 family protein [Allocoleopsis sp.]
MTILHSNPALYEEPLNQPIKAVPPALRESLFGWLERTGRFQSHEVDDLPDHKITEDLDDILEPEILEPDIYLLENEED